MRAAQDRAKISSFAAPHDFSHTTRANIAHERTEQIRARIVCTPAESARRAWVEPVRRRDYQNNIYLAMFARRRAPKSEPRGSP